MDSRLKNYNYSKKYLFTEIENPGFKKNLEDKKFISNEKYQWNLVDSISRKKFNGELYDYIQKDDKELGWTKLKQSAQIFRFPNQQCKVIDEKFEENELNKLMNHSKNYRALFKDKILNIKCEMTYNGEKYYGIFLNQQFQGFHHEKSIDVFIELNKNVFLNNKDKQLFKISNLTNPVKVDIKDKNILLVGVFSKSQIGKVKVENFKHPLWISLNDLKDNINVEPYYKSDEEKILDDIFEYIKLERDKSMAITNKIFTIKEYLQSDIKH